jgi:hypothetical protein
VNASIRWRCVFISFSVGSSTASPDSFGDQSGSMFARYVVPSVTCVQSGSKYSS